ncbi:hypothetical protein [Streptosporangium sp. NPDC023615]|uniref:hypothetical protein n=1 Tax=Streptosporangium sp. NPDC023615 TaxID=3154794 RepID=UPI00343325F9
MTETIGTTGSTKLSSRACGHSHCESHIVGVGAGPLREYCEPLDQTRYDGETRDGGTTGTRPAVRSPDPGETVGTAAVRDGVRSVEASRSAEWPVHDAEDEERRQVIGHERTRHENTGHENTGGHDNTGRANTGHESLLAAAQRKAADQTALATHALSLQQREWRRAEALAVNNKRLQDTCQALQRELTAAREETTAARIRTCRLDYRLTTLREQYVMELRQLHQETTEQVRILRAELTTAGKEIDGLRVALSRVREQTRIMGGRVPVADEPAHVVRAHVPVAREQLPVTPGRPGSATSPARGRHRRRAPSHRANRRGLWPGARPDGLSWMGTRPSGILSPTLTAIVTWLIRLR